MSVGLWDADKTKYYTAPLNLELMKLSTYYKNKGQIVTMAPELDINKYSKFILRKDYNDGEFYPDIMDTEGVECGGLAFSNDIYIPLDESIEKLNADIYIYGRFRGKVGTKKYEIAAFETMMRAQHLRLSLDGASVWNKFEQQIDINKGLRTVFIHDKNLEKIDGAPEVINYLMKKNNQVGNYRSLATKFPIIVDNIKDLKTWLSFSSSSQYYIIQYNKLMEDEELYEVLESLNYKTSPKKMEYIVTASSQDENDFIEHHIMKIFYQALFFRMKKIKVLLKYEDDFFVDKRWERVLDLFNSYITTAVILPTERFDQLIPFDSMYSFVCSFCETIHFHHRFSRQDARDLFLFVRERKYELFKEFYDCHTVKLVGGQFQPWTIKE